MTAQYDQTTTRGALLAQIEGHWDDIARPRLAGLTDEALAQLDTEYERWITGLRGWSEQDFSRPCGPSEGPYAEYPRATIVAHINRELIHHLAEVALLRDLYAHRG